MSGTTGDKNSLEKDFAQTTSCHGFIHVYNAHFWPLRVCWILIMIVAGGALMFNCYSIIKSYSKFETVSEVTMKVRTVRMA